MKMPEVNQLLYNIHTTNQALIKTTSLTVAINKH